MIIHLLHFAGGRRHGGFGDLTVLGAFQVSSHLTAKYMGVAAERLEIDRGSKKNAQHATSKTKAIESNATPGHFEG